MPAVAQALPKAPAVKSYLTAVHSGVRRFEPPDGCYDGSWFVEFGSHRDSFLVCWYSGTADQAQNREQKEFTSRDKARDFCKTLVEQKVTEGFKEVGLPDSCVVNLEIFKDEFDDEGKKHFVELELQKRGNMVVWYAVGQRSGKVGDDGEKATWKFYDEDHARQFFQYLVAVNLAKKNSSTTEPKIPIEGLLREIPGAISKQDADATEVIEALQDICKSECTFVGELDHFRYEKDDFPWLWQFQFGDGSTSKISIRYQMKVFLAQSIGPRKTSQDFERS